MSAYKLETLLRKWDQGELTTEQAIGQILLLVQMLAGRVGQVERQIARQRPSGPPTETQESQ